MDRSDDSCTYVNNAMSVNTCRSLKDRLEKNYDRIKALEESKKILALLSPMIDRHHDISNHGNIVLSSCYFCKLLMPASRESHCKLCNECFCARHKNELNHSCEKLSKDTAKYLDAKNQFKLKLREAKSKAVR